MIAVRDLSKKFGRARVLNSVAFDVAPGDAVALWGPNGAGKSTALRCALGLLNYRGSITIDGLEVRRSGRSVRRLVGYVPQELSFYDDLRVRDAMRFFRRIRGDSPANAASLLEQVNLHEHRGKRIRNLSGGMKQRLALAIALLADPPVLLLDEPTSNLDAAGRADVLERLRRLHNNGKTILFTSHRSEEMEALADRILTMENGVIVGERRPRRAAHAHAHATTHHHADAGIGAAS